MTTTFERFAARLDEWAAYELFPVTVEDACRRFGFSAYVVEAAIGRADGLAINESREIIRAA